MAFEMSLLLLMHELISIYHYYYIIAIIINDKPLPLIKSRPGRQLINLVNE